MGEGVREFLPSSPSAREIGCSFRTPVYHSRTGCDQQLCAVPRCKVSYHIIILHRCITLAPLGSNPRVCCFLLPRCLEAAWTRKNPQPFDGCDYHEAGSASHTPSRVRAYETATYSIPCGWVAHQIMNDFIVRPCWGREEGQAAPSEGIQPPVLSVHGREFLQPAKESGMAPIIRHRNKVSLGLNTIELS